MSRRRYRYDPEMKAVVEIAPDFDDAPRRAQTATEELTYGNLVATDGTVLDTRKKHREYMKAHGVSPTSDWSETWARAAKERAEVLTGEAARRERASDLARTYHELSTRKRR
jgi:hypothetical protein